MNKTAVSNVSKCSKNRIFAVYVVPSSGEKCKLGHKSFRLQRYVRDLGERGAEIHMLKIRRRGMGMGGRRGKEKMWRNRERNKEGKEWKWTEEWLWRDRK